MTHVSTVEAHALQTQGHVYVDVRSSREFERGHPAGAVNVPLLEADATGQMAPNPEFVRVMQSRFPAETALLIGCQVGGRSMRAAQILDTFGFTSVANVRGGFGGARDASGRVIDVGWADAGLPVETGQPAGRNYADLLAAADDDSR